MPFSALSAISPLDGRYQTTLAPMAALTSESAYMQRRVQVEVAWLLGLADTRLSGLPPLSPAARMQLLDWARDFDENDARAVKEIEQTTRHDVKAVEYWLRARMQQHEELRGATEFVHFACTSEDINNNSHALQLQAARDQVLLPAMDHVLQDLRRMAHEHAAVPMLSRTHGQAASPTTMGKELANFALRLQRARATIAVVPMLGKLNGAVGNYNAHLVAYPDVDWEALARRVVESPPPTGLGLVFQPWSTQIEPHDYMAELFDAVARANTICLDLARDIWGYVSLGYFRQQVKAGEVGSSTMPHKVNPIDFENAEGNFGLSNALLRHLADKLPISRWQRDLSDSTVLRNMGVALGHALLGYDSLRKGLGKLKLDEAALAADLDSAWEVLAEPVQTMMRRFGIPGAYEKLKELTRGQHIHREPLQALIRSLDIPEAQRQQLLALTPSSYLGKAEELARRV